MHRRSHRSRLDFPAPDSFFCTLLMKRLIGLHIVACFDVLRFDALGFRRKIIRRNFSMFTLPFCFRTIRTHFRRHTKGFRLEVLSFLTFRL